MDAPKQGLPQKMLPLEKLDALLKVVGIQGWFTLLFFATLGVVAIVWSVLGTIPITISGKCLAFDPDTSLRIRSPTAGLVEEIFVKPGDPTREGEVLAVVAGQNILSPDNGEVSWVDAVQGDEVEPDDILLWIHFPDTPESLKILAFVPLQLGQQIHPGMEVLTALDTVDTERYGMIRGKVLQVTPYPISASDSSMQKIPSKPLREFLVSSDVPSILVIVTPLLDPTTPSHLKWTSKAGPPCVIQPGTIGMARITLDRVRPLSFLLPTTAKEKKCGS